MIEELLPPSVPCVDTFDDSAAGTLFPEEAAVIARAVDSRRREFATARFCARSALARLGVPAQPILPGPRGAPGWPAGIVGSMTHCTGYRAAAVSWARDLLTIGLDAEPDEPLPAGILETVARPGERAWLAQLAADRPQVCWDRLLFSAKESVYKAWFPLTCRWLDFHEAEIAIDPDLGTFSARLLPAGGSPFEGFEGRWLARRGLVVTAIAVPAQR